jgi:RNA polymerase sigma factor (sigma-70 family)
MEDLAQEVYLKLLGSKVQLVKTPLAYIRNTYQRLLVDYYREKRMSSSAPALRVVPPPVESMDPSSDVESLVNTEQQLRIAVNSLPATGRQVLILYLSGRSIADIGASLGITSSTVRAHLSKALAKIRGTFRSSEGPDRSVTV